MGKIKFLKKLKKISKKVLTKRIVGDIIARHCEKRCTKQNLVARFDARKKILEN